MPCDKALFVGIVAPNQPRKSAYAHMGLNHCDVIVGGLATEVSESMKKGTGLFVGNQKNWSHPIWKMLCNRWNERN